MIRPIQTIREMPLAPPLAESKLLRDVTRQMTAHVFYGTLMAQARNSSMKSGLISGGRAESAFGGQLDALYAEKMGNRERGGLADALYGHLIRQQARVDRAKPTAHEGGKA